MKNKLIRFVGVFIILIALIVPAMAEISNETKDTNQPILNYSSQLTNEDKNELIKLLKLCEMHGISYEILDNGYDKDQYGELIKVESIQDVESFLSSASSSGLKSVPYKEYRYGPQSGSNLFSYREIDDKITIGNTTIPLIEKNANVLFTCEYINGVPKFKSVDNILTWQTGLTIPVWSETDTYTNSYKNGSGMNVTIDGIQRVAIQIGDLPIGFSWSDRWQFGILLV
ncbi:hypothetical protein [Methanolapillus millepedarum]|uniref:Uncharacterized protein n=1 Tax=Methanolapillus millepedarum TaxID=3028296 RepID=A0AA96V3L4_9EURY|nr:hypothetical protein MsAc7_14690 [Methanosarcinaceae archaeon Ac7]